MGLLNWVELSCTVNWCFHVSIRSKNKISIGKIYKFEISIKFSWHLRKVFGLFMFSFIRHTFFLESGFTFELFYFMTSI